MYVPSSLNGPVNFANVIAPDGTEAELFLTADLNVTLGVGGPEVLSVEEVAASRNFTALAAAVTLKTVPGGKVKLFKGYTR